LIAKTAGKGDVQLDEKFADLSPEDRARGEQAARLWLGTATLPTTNPLHTPTATTANK
jgi:hypothetical protein